MAGQTYGTYPGRLEKYPGRILAKAMFDEQLTKMGAVEEMPQNKSQNIIWMRYLPYGGVDNQWLAAGGDTAFINKHLIAEGVTPASDSLSVTTLSTSLYQIGCLYAYTDKMRYVHEEGSEIPKEMEDQTAARIALCREMMVYGEMKGCTNAFFGGTGTSLSTVNGPPIKSMFQAISRALQSKFGGMIYSMLKSSPNWGSQSIDAGWYCYCHTDLESAFEDAVGFKKIADYGSQQKMDENEIGCIGRFRIITNPILTYYPGAGALVSNAVAGFTPKSDNGVNIDVYPIIILGKGKHGGEAFGQVALRGKHSIDATHIPVGTKSSADPHGQRGYVGAVTWQAQAILNDAWMAVAFVATNASGT